jgi:transposase-like protein
VLQTTSSSRSAGLVVDDNPILALAQRGVDVDDVTVFRWVQRFTPLLAEAARPSRRPVGKCWYVDETYIKVGGVWRDVYRAVDQHGQVIAFTSRRNGTPPPHGRSSSGRWR